jgi:hypothetical protein
MDAKQRTFLAICFLGIMGCASTADKHEDLTMRDARRRAARAGAFQSAILADGKVDATEYRRSTEAVVRCLRAVREVRFEVYNPEPSRGGELEFTFGLGGTAEAPVTEEMEQVARRAYERCHQRFASEVHVVYANQLVVPRSERPAERDRLTACLNRAGIRVSGAPTMNVLVSIVDSNPSPAVDACVEAHWNYFRRLELAPLDFAMRGRRVGGQR